MNEPYFGTRGLWWRWIAANAIGELLGLGAVAGIGFLLFRSLTEPHSWHATALVGLTFVGLGGFEGLVVGLAQACVMRRLLPAVRGWVGATVIGAMVAWAIGMLPSTIISLVHSPDAAAAPEPPLWLTLLLAAGLGVVTGPVLAIFQWQRLRPVLSARAWLWLPANAAAWCLGMPVIFLGAQAAQVASHAALIPLMVGLALLGAGALVGAVHGWFLLRLIGRGSGAA